MQYTRSQIYNAIMDAADHIEQNPGDYDFFKTEVGENCPACVWGWIGRKLGMRPTRDVFKVAELCGRDYWDLNALSEEMEQIPMYTEVAEDASRLMRLFAQKHFAPEQAHEPATQSFDEIMSDLKGEVAQAK